MSDEDGAMATLGLILGVPVAVYAFVVGAPLWVPLAIILFFVVVAVLTP